MVVKRRKTGNTTVTINTTTGRQTTSRRSGNVTHSQSNQGHNRSTLTVNHGNGWFERKTTNWNKKKRSKKDDWSWLLGDGSSTTKTKVVENVVQPTQPYETFKWPRFITFPFRALWFLFKVYVAIYVIVAIYNAIVI